MHPSKKVRHFPVLHFFFNMMLCFGLFLHLIGCKANVMEYMTDDKFIRKDAAFEEMVCRNRGLIWHVCCDYSLDRSWEAADCMQEVLCSLWRDYTQLLHPEKERAWVYRVATNTMLMLRRVRQNRAEHVVTLEEADLPDEHPDGEHYRCLLQLIDALPEKQGVIIRAHLDGFTYKEIAQMTGGNAASVAMQVNRIRKKLKKWYEAEERPVRPARPAIHQNNK